MLAHRPEVAWKAGGFFSFRNDLRAYGSPMFDAAHLPDGEQPALVHSSAEYELLGAL
jgi:hypothetical protein